MSLCGIMLALSSSAAIDTVTDYIGDVRINCHWLCPDPSDVRNTDCHWQPGPHSSGSAAAGITCNDMARTSPSRTSGPVWRLIYAPSLSSCSTVFSQPNAQLTSLAVRHFTDFCLFSLKAANSVLNAETASKSGQGRMMETDFCL
eukprot:g82725.t1